MITSRIMFAFDVLCLLGLVFPIVVVPMPFKLWFVFGIVLAAYNVYRSWQKVSTR